MKRESSAARRWEVPQRENKEEIEIIWERPRRMMDGNSLRLCSTLHSSVNTKYSSLLLLLLLFLPACLPSSEPSSFMGSATVSYLQHAIYAINQSNGPSYRLLSWFIHSSLERTLLIIACPSSPLFFIILSLLFIRWRRWYCIYFILRFWTTRITSCRTRMGRECKTASIGCLCSYIAYYWEMVR